MNTMKRSTRIIIMTATCLALMACDGLNNSEQGNADERATAFAEAYFNYDFERAMKYVTPESEAWLRFAASNVQEGDVRQLREMEAATTEIAKSDYDTDSTATVMLNVSDYLQPGGIGQESHVVSHGTYRLRLVKREGRWYVRMEGLPRNETRSRD